MSFAALPMYDWPEAREETDYEWNTIRDVLREKGLDAPDHLIRTNSDLPPPPHGTDVKDGSPIASVPGDLPPGEFDLMTVWQHPLLVFGQTCWGPLEQGLDRKVVVVGQPNYSRFEGGEGAKYSSAILMRRGTHGNSSCGTMETLLKLLRGKRLAFNSLDSMSGLLALERDLQLLNESLDIFSERIETGGHRASIQMVVERKADVCAIDCRTLDLAKRFEPAAKKLEVIGWTSKRKGLPYITSRHRPAWEVEKIKEVLAGLETFTPAWPTNFSPSANQG